VICAGWKTVAVVMDERQLAAPLVMVTAADELADTNTEELGVMMATVLTGVYSPAGKGLVIFETDSVKLEADR
jgi:hypothetical protein